MAACCAFGTYAAWAVAGAAFAGAMAATFLVVIVARKSSASRTTVVLGGVAVTACLNAVTETIITMVPDAALANVDFRVGGFSSVNQTRLLPAAILILAGIAVICTLTNELDVLATRGIAPVFISCKTCEVRTEALNELAILRDRFGGKTAKAAVVTAERGGGAMRSRAAELGIRVIDLDDLAGGSLGKQIRRLLEK